MTWENINSKLKILIKIRIFNFIYITMFTKFKDFFKTNNSNSRQYDSPSGSRVYTQEELDENLIKSIDNSDYNTFTDMIKRGANINKKIDLGYGLTSSPLQNCLYGWRYGDRDQVKFLKFLFQSGVNLFDLTTLGPDNIHEIDVYDTINKLFSPEYRQRVIDSLLKNYPDYMEERELRNTSNKYNL